MCQCHLQLNAIMKVNDRVPRILIQGEVHTYHAKITWGKSFPQINCGKRSPTGTTPGRAPG